MSTISPSCCQWHYKIIQVCNQSLSKTSQRQICALTKRPSECLFWISFVKALGGNHSIISSQQAAPCYSNMLKLLSWILLNCVDMSKQQCHSSQPTTSHLTFQYVCVLQPTCPADRGISVCSTPREMRTPSLSGAPPRWGWTNPWHLQVKTEDIYIISIREWNTFYMFPIPKFLQFSRHEFVHFHLVSLMIFQHDFQPSTCRCTWVKEDDGSKAAQLSLVHLHVSHLAYKLC